MIMLLQMNYMATSNAQKLNLVTLKLSSIYVKISKKTAIQSSIFAKTSVVINDSLLSQVYYQN